MKKEFELYQDEKGNVYEITTDLEQLILQDFYVAMKRNNEKQDEIERLNNIINELEKWLKYQWYEIGEDLGLDEVLNKIKELKGER